MYFCKDQHADTDDSELAREKMWARIHLIPVMQAEEDRDQVRRMLADKAREKELLGAESKIYHSDRLGYNVYLLVKGILTVILGSSDRRMLLRLARLRNRESGVFRVAERRSVGCDELKAHIS